MQTGQERSAGGDIRGPGLRNQATNRSKCELRPVRPANNGPFLSVPGTTSVLPILFSRLAGHGRKRVTFPCPFRLRSSALRALVFQVVRDIRDDDSTLEEQGTLEKQRVLIM